MQKKFREKFEKVRESKIPKFFGLHAKPTQKMKKLLPIIPFLVLITLYLAISNARLQKNPDDPFFPSLSKMGQSVYNLAFTEDEFSNKYLMWEDTFSSLKRVSIGVGISALCALLVGINMALFPGFQTVFSTFFTFASIIPPLGIFPILIIAFGVDELSKIIIILIGTFPVIGRDVDLAVRKMVSQEQITKSLTLGASQLQVVYSIVLPQIIPHWLNTVRLAFGSAWLFLLAAEMIASTGGLGYRIFLARRYMAMDIIIPYVIWMTFLGILVDCVFQKFIAWRYKWYLQAKQD